MVQIKFKNLDKSELARSVVQERIEALIDKFSALKKSNIQVTLEMVNSPLQAGPDLFKLKLHVVGGKYSGITIEKAESNLYVALAKIVDHMLEVLNRFGDKSRVKERQQARKLEKKLKSNFILEKKHSSF